MNLLAARRLPMFLALGAILGCGASGAWRQTPSPAQNLPRHFATDPDRLPPVGSRGCPGFLVDERDHTRLLLVRSVAVPPSGDGDVAVGDYRTEPAGHYGLAPDELIRVQCPSGRPLGAVH